MIVKDENDINHKVDIREGIVGDDQKREKKKFFESTK